MIIEDIVANYELRAHFLYFRSFQNLLVISKKSVHAYVC